MHQPTPSNHPVNTWVGQKKAVFFDLDGTLLDSEPIHHRACQLALQEYIGPEIATVDATKYIGLNDKFLYSALVRDFVQLNNLTYDEFYARKMAAFPLVLEKIERQQILMDGVDSYLESLQAQGIALGVISASERPVVDLLLEYSQLDHFFEFKISSAHTHITKPNPSPYLMALRKKKLRTHEIVIFEDSPTGLTAANLVGCDIVKVGKNFFSAPKDSYLSIDNYRNLINIVH